jgi:hypothetical protein
MKVLYMTVLLGRGVLGCSPLFLKWIILSTVGVLVETAGRQVPGLALAVRLV